MQAAKSLRLMGFEVYNPAAASIDLPKNIESGAAGDIPRKEWIRKDVHLILDDCEGVAVLPGWQRAAGARLEVQLATELELPIYDALTGELYHETCLQEAQRIVYGDRQKAYAHPADDYDCTAKLWSAILGHEVSAEQAILCMIAVKVSRLSRNVTHRDSITDVAGYAECLQRVNEERTRRAAL
jgi:hypothetical protein